MHELVLRHTGGMLLPRQRSQIEQCFSLSRGLVRTHPRVRPSARTHTRHQPLSRWDCVA